MTTTRPNLAQYIAYSYGRTLPESMRDWVAEDLAGRGALRRHIIRCAIPPLFVLAPFWLLPATLYMHIEMTIPIYAWAVVMSVALNKVWRRHRLAQHGLDPNLVDAMQSQRARQMQDNYIQRYGPRPASAAWQTNSRPF